jgi:hypothetical protein
LWDVIVGALTTSTLEWSRDKIMVFPLNDEKMESSPLQNDDGSGDIIERTEYDNTPDVV